MNSTLYNHKSLEHTVSTLLICKYFFLLSDLWSVSCAVVKSIKVFILLQRNDRFDTLSNTVTTRVRSFLKLL